MSDLAPALWGIPVVSGSSERAALFPSPSTNQRVQNLASGNVERYDGTRWVPDPLGETSAGTYVATAGHGILGDGTTDDLAAINALIASLPVGATLIFPALTYVISGMVSVARSDLKIIAFGATFKHTGTGNAWLFDGTLVANGLRNVEMWGGMIDGNANTTIAWRYLYCGGCKFYGQRARNCTTRAFSAEFCVLCEWYNPRCTVNDATMTYKPATGFYLDRRNANENTTACTIYSPMIEGLGVGSKGFDFQYATANTVVDGSSEANETGFNLSANASNNLIIGGDHEANSSYDILCAGFFNHFLNVYPRSTLGSRFTSPAYKNTIEGGSYYGITIDSGVLSTVLKDVAYDSFLTDNSGTTQRQNVWKTPSAAFDPDRISRATSPYTSEKGFVGVYDSADQNRKSVWGIDNTLFTNGAGWLQAVRSGTSTIPLLLQAQGGSLKIGPITSPFDADTGETLQVGGTVKLKRVSYAGTAPVPAAGTGAGTGPTITCKGGASDATPTEIRYRLRVVTGSAPAGSGAIIVTIPFATALPSGYVPLVTFSERTGTAAALSGTGRPFFQSDNLNVYLISNTTGLAASTAYEWDVVVSL